MFRKPKFSMFYEIKEVRGPSGSGDDGWEGIRRGGARGQGDSGGQR